MIAVTLFLYSILLLFFIIIILHSLYSKFNYTLTNQKQKLGKSLKSILEVGKCLETPSEWFSKTVSTISLAIPHSRKSFNSLILGDEGTADRQRIQRSLTNFYSSYRKRLIRKSSVQYDRIDNYINRIAILI